MQQKEQLLMALRAVRKELASIVSNPSGPKSIQVQHLKGMLNMCNYVLKPFDKEDKTCKINGDPQ